MPNIHHTEYDTYMAYLEVLSLPIDLLQLRHHNCGHVVSKFALAILVAGSLYM